MITAAVVRWDVTPYHSRCSRPMGRDPHVSLSHVWMSRVPCQCGMLHMNEACHMRTVIRVAYWWVMSHIHMMACGGVCLVKWLWMYEWECTCIRMKFFFPHMHSTFDIWMSHVTYEWVMSHMNESCHISRMRVCVSWNDYGVATVSRIDKIIRLFREISSL